MGDKTLRFVFVPVSGTYGMGEYARSLAIARAAAEAWPTADIHFVLSKQAPYAAHAPFPTTLLDSSPTFHSAAVVKVLEEMKPDVVIFDNAGRTAQLRAARRLGSRVVYISARPRQRRKAFRLRWMRLIDEHWIAYPEFIAGGLGFFERTKLKFLGRPTVRYLDVILARTDPATRGAALARTGCTADSYVLVVPGGGTGHPGVGDVVGSFMTAARGLAARGVPTLYVGPHGALGDGNESAIDAHWHSVGSLPQADLGELMRSARLIVANGGSTLLQAVACGKACVAVPIAQDQVERTRRCVAAGVAVAAGPDAPSILRAAEYLLQNDAERLALSQRAGRLGLADGVEVALSALQRLLA